MNREVGMNEFNLHIEKYVSSGKVKRIVIKTDEENYLLDFSIDSFAARSFLTAVVEFFKAAAHVFPRFHVRVVRLSEQI